MVWPLLYKAVKYGFKRRNSKNKSFGREDSTTSLEPVLKDHKYGPVDYVFHFLPFPIILFYIFSFVGCLSTSPGMPGLNLVSLTRNSNSTGGEITVKVGYFGLCLKTPDTGEVCGASATGRSTDTVAKDLLPPSWLARNASGDDVAAGNDATAMIQTGQILQSRIFAPIFAVAGVLFVLGLGALIGLSVYIRRARKAAAKGNGSGVVKGGRPYVMLRRCVLALLWTSEAVALMSSLATSQTAAALAYAAGSIMEGPTKGVTLSKGISVEALQWTAAALELLFVLYIAYSHKTEGAVTRRKPRDAEKAWPGQGGQSRGQSPDSQEYMPEPQYDERYPPRG